MLRFSCPRCESKMSAPEKAAGRAGDCPKCGARFRLPGQRRGGSEQPSEALPVAPMVLDSEDFVLPRDLPDRPPEPIVLQPGDYVAADPPPARKPKPAPPPPPPPKPRPRVKEADPGFEVDEVEVEVVEKPVRSKARRPADDDDERNGEDDESRRPRKKRRKKRRGGGDGSGSELVLALFAFLLPIFIWGIFVVIGFVAPNLAFLSFWVAVVIMAVGHLWFMAIAYEEDYMQGMLCMWVPGYSIFYLITRIGETWKPFAVECIGTVLVVISFCMGVLAWGDRDDRDRDRNRPGRQRDMDDDDPIPDIDEDARRPRLIDYAWGGSRPTSASARRTNSFPIRFASSSTARHDWRHASSGAAGAGGEPTSI
jgi:hypothetical protein